MSEQAATPVGGAETSARPDVSAPAAEPSIKDRIKAHLFAEPEPAERPVRAESPAPSEDEPAPEAETEEAPAPNEQIEGDDAPPVKLQSVKELAQETGLEIEDILDLDVDTKIDGKQGKARLRDILKSYQLESHLTNKLTAFADEKKAFETERATHMQQRQERLQQIETAAGVAKRLLDGEFANVNWQELQATDPNAFNAKVLEYQQRQQAIRYLVDEGSKESGAAKQAADAQHQAYLAEQSKLLDSKLPEWADSAKRTKDVAEMATVLSEAYGITEQELKGIADHRQILIARDAMKWQKLQKAKPELLNKVRAAPKIVKPGTPMSQGTKDLLARKHASDKLRQTGSVRDATPLLKSILFSSR